MVKGRMKNSEGRNKTEAAAPLYFCIHPFAILPPECLASEQDVSFENLPVMRHQAARWSARKIRLLRVPNLARDVLCVMAMSSLENIYKKMAEAAVGTDATHETTQKFDPAHHVAPVVAHELNNIITIIQGYADRLLFKHGENPALEPHLKLISEAAKRAAIIIHDALPPNPGPAARQNPPTTQQPTS
jgi:signal transduction histidine kinase